MQWRCANRRRSLARVTSDLGPVIGDEPMRVPRRPIKRWSIEHGVGKRVMAVMTVVFVIWCCLVLAAQP